MDSIHEIWKDIFGYEGLYKVSNYGNVKSLNYRKIKGKEHLLNKINQYQGYLCVDLCNPKTKRYSIHRLVAFAFCDNPNKYNHVNHIDGNKSNNNSHNLEWVTCSQNHKHAFKIGLRVPTRGELCGTSKLTESEVIKIRLDYKSGEYTHKQLGIKYNISRRHIGDIVNNVCWK